MVEQELKAAKDMLEDCASKGKVAAFMQVRARACVCAYVIVGFICVSVCGMCE